MEWLRMRGRRASSLSQWCVMLIVGIVVGVFGGILTQSHATLAIEARWKDTTIQVGDLTFAPVTSDAKKDELSRPREESVFSAVRKDVISVQPKEELHVITFPQGVDPKTAKEATYLIYDMSSRSSGVGAARLPRSETKVAIEPPGSSATEAEPGSSGGEECNVEGSGWWICGISNTIANGIDFVYRKVVEDYLRTPPLDTSDPKSGAKVAWSIMRNIANVAFIIAMLVIIYSQITSSGIDNYGIKKMVPRLVIAAVLVNVSFVICAAAIDLSNIIGISLQDMLLEIRKDIMQNGTFTDVPVGWKEIISIILAGGAAGGGAWLAAGATGGSLASAAVWLLPIIVIILLTLATVFIVLAARQALIIILVVVSPLAMVAYLLPGTEKWFDKWKDALLTMLIFFPAFSLVFGGAQLASAVILQNASSIFVVLLGFGVQVAPLAIVPLILKLSGGILGKFAGIVNDKNRGLLDRTRNFSRDWSQQLAANSMKKPDSELRWYNGLRKVGRAAHYRQRRFKQRTEDAESTMKKAYAESQIGMEATLRSRATQDGLKASESTTDAAYAEMQAGTIPVGMKEKRLRFTMEHSQKAAQQLSVQALRKASAQRVLNSQFAEKMLASKELQHEAGGIHKTGQQTSVAAALNTVRSEHAKSVEEGAQIVKHFNLSSSQRQAHALGKPVTVMREDGSSYTFDADSIFTRENVIEQQYANGTVNEVIELMSSPGMVEFRTTASPALASSGVKNKAFFLGGKLIDDLAKGDISSQADVISYIQEVIAEGKFKTRDLVGIDSQGLTWLMKAATEPVALRQKPDESDSDYTARVAKRQAKITAGKNSLMERAQEALSNDDLSVDIVDNVRPLLEKIRRGDFTL
ncbi:MAG: hypothetical protein Q4A34_02655 [Candidatus Saccharibacteria bacterium]|nr:hypothetical protein [Candidatus Saccharibacteria bacterium]